MGLRRTSKYNDGMIGGVCGGLGEYTKIDSSLWRITFILLMFTPIPIITIYIIGWLIIPKQ